MTPWLQVAGAGSVSDIRFGDVDDRMKTVGGEVILDTRRDPSRLQAGLPVGRPPAGGVGAGVFLQGPLVGLRIDVARGLGSGTRVHFTLGTTF